MFRLAQADTRNRLLQALSPGEFALLASRLVPVDLSLKQVLISPDEPIPYAYFPEAGLSSFLALFEGGGALEVGMIGPEGMVGLHLVLGADTIPNEVVIQIPGRGWRIDAVGIRAALDQSVTLHKVLLRSVVAFQAQVSQTGACNGVHRLEERLARWLLMAHDRSDGDRLPLTQEFLSTMLGVRRAGVTVAAGTLQKAGIISYKSGDIEIVNRPALEAASCECYGIVRREEERLFP